MTLFLEIEDAIPEVLLKAFAGILLIARLQ
jgi:hypothetical protein